MKSIRNATVLGSGIMGSQIAALLASVGIPVRLLDIVPAGLAAGEPRNQLAASAIENLKKISPAPLMYSSAAALITPGNLEDDLASVANSDWVIEVVVERLDVKQAVWRRVAEYARPGTILSTNTSGLSCSALAEVLPVEHRRNFLGTHFFNPPRYLKLLELIPIAETDPDILQFMKKFGERIVGKGVVVCRDTPNFIGNRVGVYGLAVTLRAMGEMGLGVDEVDAITGPAMGRPRSATFRTLDLVGLDTFVHVATNIADTTDDPEERDLMALPPYIRTMMERGWLGEKSGLGFYKKLKSSGGPSQILTLDFESMQYQPKRETHFESVSAAGRVKDAVQRIRSLVESEDAAGLFAWRILSQVMAFSARKVGEIANGDVNAVDRAMRWGFNWEIGPFEAWNALGVKAAAERMRADGIELPDWVDGVDRFPVDRAGEQPLSFTVLKSDRHNVVKQTAGVTLLDLGDEVLGLQMHGPKQSIAEDYISAARNAAEEVERNWRGLVVSAEGSNFSVGANLMMVVLAAQARHWELLERACRGLQETNMLLKYLGRPVVVAPFGITVGGGAEIAMHCARTVAAAETYMGLVELGVGIIPAGGGTKEMALRSAQRLLQGNSQLPNRPDLISFIGPAFENIALAKTSTSAAEARELGYLRQTDLIVRNGDHLLKQAKDAVLELDREGYVPAPALEVPVAGADGRAVLDLAAYTLKNGGYASEYDVYLANKLAYVITGGDLPAGTRVPEQYLLDLEREAFLQLIGEPKTLERMAYMLKSGKPLRN
jgi:3-hydroxyacyl-CoA dehydrogenase